MISTPRGRGGLVMIKSDVHVGVCPSENSPAACNGYSINEIAHSVIRIWGDGA